MATIIAIDGPAGSGKSTLARRLAAALDLSYLNTGLMYRAATLKALRAGLDVDDAEAMVEVARETTFDLDRTLHPAELRIDGVAPDPELASAEVESRVSRASRHAALRAYLRDEQRRLAQEGAVMEGRDIGSVVAPDATLKIFLEARPDERVARRTLERLDAAAEGTAEALTDRDAQDARTNPFQPASDALVIDTTDLDADGVFEVAIEVVRQRIGGGR